MKLFPDISNIIPETGEINDRLAAEKNIFISVLRLDRIHPVISGNKLFKLYYYIMKAHDEPGKKIITSGGAWSNHLAATAATCKENNISSVGIVRGEKPVSLSGTLQYCISQGMELEFITREQYRSVSGNDSREYLLKKYGPHIFIPAGGYDELGVRGAEIISTFFNKKNYDIVCCAAGTGTTICGLLRSCPETGFIAFNVLNNPGLENEIAFYAGSHTNYSVISDYTFGGYAKKNNELISFMNDLYSHFKIPTDFVYTGKMMFGVFDMIQKNRFKPGSRILCIHTGGLQGNKSLHPGILNF